MVIIETLAHEEVTEDPAQIGIFRFGVKVKRTDVVEISREFPRKVLAQILYYQGPARLLRRKPSGGTERANPGRFWLLHRTVRLTNSARLTDAGHQRFYHTRGPSGVHLLNVAIDHEH